jgi:hypothetical protein
MEMIASIVTFHTLEYILETRPSLNFSGHIGIVHIHICIGILPT